MNELFLQVVSGGGVTMSADTYAGAACPKVGPRG